MEVPITQFRREIFELANRALEGETITIVYKGKRLRIEPEMQSGSRWDKVTKLQILNPDGPGLEDESWKEEIMAEWLKEWDELG